MNFLKRNISDIIFIIVALIIFMILTMNFSLLYIRGDSMYPSYSNGDILILNKEKTVTNGDIIVFESPESWLSESSTFIKRVIAQEGDLVEITKNSITVNGEVLNVKKEDCEEVQENSFVIVGPNYLTLGDNHNGSNDGVSQYCKGNEEFLVSEDSIVTNGKQFLLIGGWFD